MPNNTSSVYGPADDELRRRAHNRERVDLGIHVERDRARVAQGHLVVVRGLVSIDIHASAGVIRHPARHPRHAVDPGRRVAPIEISCRGRDLPQRIVLRDPVQEQGQRRPPGDITVLALRPEVIESSLQYADLHGSRGGLDKDRAAAVAGGRATFERRRAAP